MADIDLITLSSFVNAWGAGFGRGVTLNSAQQTAVPWFITAASDAIQRYCNRWFGVRDYIEIRNPICGQWDKPDPDYIGLSWFPILPTTQNPSCTVRTNRQTALVIANQNNPNVQDAWFQLVTTGAPEFGLPQPCGITLTSVSSGVYTSATFPFLGTPVSAGFSASAGGTGGTLATGTYLVAYSLTNPAGTPYGESVPSATVSVGVTLGQTITVTLPTLPPYATGFNIYLSTTNGGSGTITLQNSSPGTAATYIIGAAVSGASPQTANYGTLQQIATAINNLGGGWTTQLQGPSTQFAPWPSWDVWASCGTQVGCLSTGYLQGLDIFATRMVGVQLDVSSGCLYLPKGTTSYGSGPGNVTQWPGSMDIVMGGANWNGPVLLRYGAGFTTIPHVVQEACAELVKAMIERFGTSSTLQREDVGDYTREAYDMIPNLPPPVRKALGSFRFIPV